MERKKKKNSSINCSFSIVGRGEERGEQSGQQLTSVNGLTNTVQVC